MAEIAVYGGSFDPPHVAHRRAVEYLVDEAGFSRVLVVPVHEHALEKKLAPFEHRIAMCEASMLTRPGVEVSRIEASLSPPNYTLNTLRAIRVENPGAKLRLVVGADVLLEVDKWHAFDEVCRMAPLFALGRRGIETGSAPTPVLPEVSSSAVRQLLSGRPEGNLSQELRRELSHSLTVAVIDYIEQHDLYR